MTKATHMWNPIRHDHRLMRTRPIGQNDMLVFDNATTRDAAIPSPTNGMVCGLDDSDTIVVYLGSEWHELVRDGHVNDISVAAEAAYKSSAQIGSFPQSFASKQYVYNLDLIDVPSGHLTYIGSLDPGDQAHGVWGDGKYIYLASGSVGLHVYSVDNSGSLSHVGSDSTSSDARNVWGDGRFLYVADGASGIHSYSVDDTGSLTHISTHHPGVGSARGVWGDGRFVYVGYYNNGVHSYSVDKDGNLTHIDSHNPGDNTRTVWGDGDFIYIANGAGGVHSYSVDDSGNLTHIDSHDPGEDARGVWGDGRFLYIANTGGGLHSYSVDSSGNLTPVDSNDPGGTALRVWGDGKLLYVANGDSGLQTFSADSSGTLTAIDSDDQGGNARDIWSDGRYIYLANYGEGIASYQVDDAYAYDTGAEKHTFATAGTDRLTIDSSGYVKTLSGGTLAIVEKGADPPDPPEGESYIWVSDGTGTGSDGDLYRKTTAGGTTYTGAIQAVSSMGS